MRHFETFDVDDLKLIYVTLQAQLLEVEALMDSAFLSDLQDHLRKQAIDAGVDTNDHQQWAGWLAQRKSEGGARLRLVKD
jgi:hypothetical protein